MKKEILISPVLSNHSKVALSNILTHKISIFVLSFGFKPSIELIIKGGEILLLEEYGTLRYITGKFCQLWISVFGFFLYYFFFEILSCFQDSPITF